MENDQKETNNTVTSHCDDQTREVDPNHAGLQLEPHHGEVTDVIRTEGEDQDEESVERNHPENCNIANIAVDKLIAE